MVYNSTKDREKAGAETIANSLTRESAAVKEAGRGRQKRGYVVKAEAKGPDEGTVKKEPEKKRGRAEKSKAPHVGVDFEMPTLEQVSEFVREEAEKGTVSLTATDFRRHFTVPGKIPFNTRLKQLERSGYGRFSKVGRSNTLTLDIEAITSGKAAVKGKAPKPKVGKSEQA